MEQTLLLESFTYDNKEYTTKLIVGDDGVIYLKLPESCHILVSNEVEAVGDMTFLLAYIHKGSRSKMLTPVKENKEGEVRDFFRYWTNKRLLEVKNKKWLSFLDFWRFTLDWIDSNIDITDVTYQLYFTDHREYEGDLNIYFNICIGDRFILEDSSYQVYFELNNRLLNAYLDYYEKDDEYMWWSNIFVQFKPELYDINSHN